MIRVTLTGSECTGKTTLAAALARHYRTLVVPEFVRSFAEQKGSSITFGDHGPIARGQMALEDSHAEAACGIHKLMFLDTDLLSTVVYCKHYFGRCPEWIEDAARARRPNLFLLCETDVPWVPDGVRDRGDRRDELQSLFRNAVATSGTPFVPVRGLPDERMALATLAIDSL